NKRFAIVFQSKAETLSTEHAQTNEALMYYQQTTNTFYVKKLYSEVKNFAILNMRGQRVMELQNVSNSSLESGLALNNMATGAYVVCLRTASNKVLTKKIIVK
ncbi:hypothetical protein PK35_12745, partial [Tamlana nanhaiensis]